jgi:predicted AlkP superfamily pyrophosphatase or phosphodiesterase
MRAPLSCLAVALCLLLTSTLALAAPSRTPASPRSASPKLVLTLVIDQFRADTLMRFQSRFLPARNSKGQIGGYQYLMQKGAYYPYATYDTLHAMTGPGHATILSGSYPYQNGIPVNTWFDRNAQKKVYCAEDSNHFLVGPSEEKVRRGGTSPKNFMGTTVGDELKNSGYPSRVVSIALKDRSAIFMGGSRSDHTLWFDDKSWSWVTSSFYSPDLKLPAWVKDINQKLQAEKDKPYHWKLGTEPETGFSLKDSFALTDSYNAGSLGGVNFPHEVGGGQKGLLKTPYGLQMTESLAEAAITALKLGTQKTSDLLAVSFSTHDYLAHAFGPNSREIEEMTVVEDEVIAKLLRFLDQKVPGGIEQVLVVLTADHGGPNSPEYLKNARIDAGRVDDEVLQKEMEQALVQKFGKPSTGNAWITGLSEFHYTFNAAALAASRKNNSDFETVAKQVALRTPGVARVLTRSELLQQLWGPGLLGKQTQFTYYENRTGDLIVILKPNYINPGETVHHFTGYAYDRYVPLIFAGAPIKSGRFAQEARVIDIAPTLSWLTHTTPPALSEGRVLHEILLP